MIKSAAPSTNNWRAGMLLQVSSAECALVVQNKKMYEGGTRYLGRYKLLSPLWHCSTTFQCIPIQNKNCSASISRELRSECFESLHQSLSPDYTLKSSLSFCSSLGKNLTCLPKIRPTFTSHTCKDYRLSTVLLVVSMSNNILYSSVRTEAAQL